MLIKPLHMHGTRLCGPVNIAQRCLVVNGIALEYTKSTSIAFFVIWLHTP